MRRAAEVGRRGRRELFGFALVGSSRRRHAQGTRSTSPRGTPLGLRSARRTGRRLRNSNAIQKVVLSSRRRRLVGALRPPTGPACRRGARPCRRRMVQARFAGRAGPARRSGGVARGRGGAVAAAVTRAYAHPVEVERVSELRAPVPRRGGGCTSTTDAARTPRPPSRGGRKGLSSSRRSPARSARSTTGRYKCRRARTRPGSQCLQALRARTRRRGGRDPRLGHRRPARNLNAAPP